MLAVKVNYIPILNSSILQKDRYCHRQRQDDRRGLAHWGSSRCSDLIRISPEFSQLFGRRPGSALNCSSDLRRHETSRADR